MTNEDAIKWLENLKQDIGQLRHADLWPYAQAIDEIIATMEEQKAVEPDYDPATLTWSCGNCGQTFDRCKNKFCYRCGRPVKWDA